MGRMNNVRTYDKLFDELQLDRRIPIVSCDRADSPMVLGFIHPVLVLPAEEYSDEELYFIFKHEFIHYKRHDVCLKLLFVLANAVHWFNTVIWLMQREAVVDMELSCDKRVMLDADYTAKKLTPRYFFLYWIINVRIKLLYPHSFTVING